MFRIVIFYISIVLFMLVVLIPTPAGLVQDSIYKYFQTMDYIQADGVDFSIHNHDYELDPENQFGIFTPPFAYLIQKKVYMTFPWFWVYINAPLLKVFGFFGIYIFAALAGLLSIFSLKSLVSHFTKNESLIRNTLYFYLFGSSLLIYSVWFYEGTICNLCLFLFLDLELRKKTDDSYLKTVFVFFASLCLLSILVLLRTEVFFLAILMYFAIIFRSFSHLMHRFGYLVLYAGIPSFIFLYSNYLIWDTPIGLRFLVTSSFTFSERLIRIFEYFFSEKYCMFFYLPTFFLTFFLFKDWKTLRHEVFFRIYLVCLVFMVMIPLVSPQQQGSDIMPRFYFPVIPILAFLIFYTIDKYMDNRKRLIRSFVFIQSGIFLLITIAVFIFSNRRMDRVYKGLSPYIGKANLVSLDYLGHLVQNAEKRNVYLADGQPALRRITEKLAKNKKEDFYFFLWEYSYYDYYHKYLNANYERVTKIEEFYIYRYKK